MIADESVSPPKKISEQWTGIEGFGPSDESSNIS